MGPWWVLGGFQSSCIQPRLQLPDFWLLYCLGQISHPTAQVTASSCAPGCPAPSLATAACFQALGTLTSEPLWVAFSRHPPSEDSGGGTRAGAHTPQPLELVGLPFSPGPPPSAQPPPPEPQPQALQTLTHPPTQASAPEL